MWSSYLKTAARTLRAHKAYSTINVVGLAVSIAVCLLILAFAWDQASYDDFHEKGDRIVRVLTDALNEQGEVESSFAATPAPLAQTLEDEVPGIEKTTRLGQLRTHVIYEGAGVPAEGLFVEPSFFELFDFRLSQGSPGKVLSQPGQVLLTHETARRVFGDADPMGKTIELEGQGTYRVGGIVAPPPGKTHLKFELLVSFVSQRTTNRKDALTDWGNRWAFATYVLLQDESVIPQLQHALDAVAERRYGDMEAPLQFRVQALEDIALGPVLGNEIASFSVPAIVIYFLAALGAMIMLAAGFNYVSLSVARTLRRTREMGVRKAMGAGRGQIVGQLLGEAVLMALLATGVAAALLLWLLPSFNGLTFVQMAEVQIPVSRLLDPWLLGSFVGFSVLVGLLAGLYPAIRLSRFQAASVLQGQDDVSGFSGRRLRHTLTGVQFALALFFVISATLLYQQFNHVVSADYGFDRERVMTVGLQGQPLDVVMSELSRQSGIQTVAATSQLPASGATSRRVATTEDGESEIPIYVYAASPDFIETMGLRLLAGRSFSRSLGRDTSSAVILNETAVAQLGFSNAEAALGQRVDVDGREEEQKVIGAVEDYQYHMMTEPIEAMLLYYEPDRFRHVVARVQAGSMDRVIASTESLWEDIDPVHAPQVASLNAQVTESPTNRVLGDVAGIVGFITVVAVLISGLGLLGMALYTVETRLKEVGVRKVLGATRKSLMLLLSRDVLKIVAIATVLVLPVAWLASNVWLQFFANRVAISPWLLGGCAAVMVVVALAIVSTQTLRAARVDPATTLRSE